MKLAFAALVAVIVALLAAVVVIFNNAIIMVSMLVSVCVFLYLVFVLRAETKTGKGVEPKRLSSISRKRKTGQIKLPFSIAFVAALAVPSGFSVYLAISSPSVESIYSIIISYGMGITFLFSSVNLPLSIYHKYRESKMPLSGASPKISIIIPAYNEELLIGRTIESLLECDYPSKEIVVVDDGSQDGTQGIALRYAQRSSPSEDGSRIIVARKENGGKASAINFGLQFATGDVIIVVDADSITAREALKEMVKHFKDPGVVAVGGNVRVMNRWNLLTKCQALEYISGINLFKRAFDFLGVVMIVPGALGAFRKKALSEMGNYDTNTLTEDFDTTLKVLKSGSSVQASSNALSFTEAPTTLRDLYKQRIRWNRGNFQTMLKHRDVMSNPRLGMLHDFGYPAVILTMLISPALGMAVTAFTILALVQGMWPVIAVSFTLFVCIQTAFCALALLMEEDEDWKLLVYSPLFVIGYKQFQDFVILKSMVDVALRKNLKWTSAKRSGIISKGRRDDSTASDEKAAAA